MRMTATIRGRFIATAALVALCFVAVPVMAQDTPAAPESQPAEAKGPDWQNDVARAKAMAKKEGKDLLINFTGSDWCVWCKRLDGEVFATDKFLDGDTSKKFVYLYLDFPRDEALKAKVKDVELNEQLRESYGVEGFPTIILADADGHPYARTGYQAGGAENYNGHLDGLFEKGATVKALVANSDDAKQAELLEAAFPVLVEQELLGYTEYASLLEAAGKVESLADAVAAFNATVKLKEMLQTPEPNWEEIHGFLAKNESLGGPEFLNACWFCVTMYLEGEKKFDEGLGLLRRMLEDPLVKGDERGQGMIRDKIAQFEKMLEPAGDDG